MTATFTDPFTNRKQKAGSLLLLRACPGGCPSCGWSLMRWRSGR